MSWLEQAEWDPEQALVRLAAALGLVLAVRLAAALLLALVARVPGWTGVRAARWSILLSPPHARRYVRLLVGVSLSSWTGVALAAPALAATQPTATVVPAPVLAPPEATLQTWPDLGRPGTDLPTATEGTPSRHAPAWPDLARPGSDLPPPAPERSEPATPAGTDVPHPTPTARSASGPAAPGQPASAPRPRSAPAPTATEVVVAPGDCLWTLAERHLEQTGQPAAAPTGIAAATEKWWQANRAVIGDDPDRLLPGQHLRPPR